MTRRPGAAALLAALVASLLAISPAAGQTTSSNGRVVSASNEGGDWDVWTMRFGSASG